MIIHGKENNRYPRKNLMDWNNHVGQLLLSKKKTFNYKIYNKCSQNLQKQANITGYRRLPEDPLKYKGLLYPLKNIKQLSLTSPP